MIEFGGPGKSMRKTIVDQRILAITVKTADLILGDGITLLTIISEAFTQKRRMRMIVTKTWILEVFH
jgi:hypothetical protein